MLAAVIGIVGNQLVARYKGRVGREIKSAPLIVDARHSWLRVRIANPIDCAQAM
jgi:divalent metal cation (Fe/Co/Zn/Cd) transporter